MRLAFLAAIVAVVAFPAEASSYRWLSGPTPASSPELVALHERLVAPSLEGVRGAPVQDLHWRDEDFDLHLISGVLFLEPAVDGCAYGAYFTGQATIRFTPPLPRARSDMNYWFAAEKLLDEPVTEVLFFTVRGSSVLDQLGASGQPSAPLADADGYQQLKDALRQLGAKPLHAFLNREGRSRGTSFVIVNAPGMRIRASKDAYLMYSNEPDEEVGVALSATGHDRVSETNPYKMFWHPLVSHRSDERPFQPHGRVSEYQLDLRLGRALDSAEETATIVFTPGPGMSALRLNLTPELVVQSVRGADGAPLRFLQWRYLKTDPNYDEAVLVAKDRPWPATPGQSITLELKGQLFEPFFNSHFLRAEDLWQPLLDDPQGAVFDVRLAVPPEQVGVAPGDLLQDVADKEVRRYHFRSHRPFQRATVYFGDFMTSDVMAGDTKIQLFGEQSDPKVRQNMKFVLTELQNIVKIFTTLYGPLETPVLRVAGTPTAHGRGFEGLVLLSQHAGFGAEDSNSDIFRAHEIAHQWWGNLVQPKNWPEDRWLSESLAEFSALEYFRIRYPGDRVVKEKLSDWARPILEAPKVTAISLKGEERKIRSSEISPLMDGGENVYVKGPLVLHMLRYMFKLVKGDDAAFWTMLRDFLAQHRYERVSTAEFTAHVEKALGAKLDWFWDQWLVRGEIPTVRWTSQVVAKEGKHVLTVSAQQEGTNFNLSIPVYIRFKNDRVLMRPLAVRGAQGQLQLTLPEAPEKVTLNDFSEALVILKQPD